MPWAVEIENLSHVYSKGTPFEKTAVDSVSLQIETGDFVGVIGHTGSGKSTLIQHLNGLLKPTSGKVRIHGQDIWEKPKEIRKFRFQVGLVFQYPEYQLFEETVYKDIAFGPGNMGLTQEEIHRRVLAAADFTGLSQQLLEKSPFELSGGQKRRVAIAGVMAMEPDVLILDEPTAGLDPKGRDKILTELAEYHRLRGNTVLLVSHSMEDIARFCRHVLVMNHGKIVMFDETERVFARAAEIAAMGLSVPQVSSLFASLAQEGLPVNPHVYTVAQAKAELLRLLQERGKATPC